MQRQVPFLVFHILLWFAIANYVETLPTLQDQCLEFDIADLEKYVSTLNLANEPTLDTMTAGFKCPITTLPFGFLRSDWARLLLLDKALPEDSILNQKLQRLVRILIVAYQRIEGGLVPRTYSNATYIRHSATSKGLVSSTTRMVTGSVGIAEANSGDTEENETNVDENTEESVFKRVTTEFSTNDGNDVTTDSTENRNIEDDPGFVFTTLPGGSSVEQSSLFDTTESSESVNTDDDEIKVDVDRSFTASTKAFTESDQIRSTLSDVTSRRDLQKTTTKEVSIREKDNPGYTPPNSVYDVFASDPDKFDSDIDGSDRTIGEKLKRLPVFRKQPPGNIMNDIKKNVEWLFTIPSMATTLDTNSIEDTNGSKDVSPGSQKRANSNTNIEKNFKFFYNIRGRSATRKTEGDVQDFIQIKCKDEST